MHVNEGIREEVLRNGLVYHKLCLGVFLLSEAREHVLVILLDEVQILASLLPIKYFGVGVRYSAALLHHVTHLPRFDQSASSSAAAIEHTLFLFFFLFGFLLLLLLS